MKVFICWSGRASYQLGYRLREWCKSIVPDADPFLSSSDIPGGAEWFRSLAEALADAQFGIVCLTPEAQQSPWLAFEAGALWRQTGAQVVPVVAGLAPRDIVGPFAQLQAKRFERRDIRSMFGQIARATGLEPAQFELNFKGIWPSLERDVRHDLGGHGIKIDDEGSISAG